MAPYIGTATSRVDGLAKVTGAARYAGEFNAPGLLHGSMVAATITKGRITRIDAAAALQVEGVVAVLTHENRPPMADNDQAYKDDVAPDGSPFRPLYDGRILFNGQPIALVVAETPEVARFAASLVRVAYETRAPCHGHLSGAGSRRAVKDPANPFEALFTPPKPRGAPGAALAAAAVRHEGEYSTPIEHHNPMELFATTAIVEKDGRLTVYDKTQGVQNVQRYLCSVLRPEAGGAARHVGLRGRRLRRGLAPAVPGGARRARGARAGAIRARRADAPADVRAGPPSRDDPAHRHGRASRRNPGRDHP